MPDDPAAGARSPGPSEERRGRPLACTRARKGCRAGTGASVLGRDLRDKEGWDGEDPRGDIKGGGQGGLRGGEEESRALEDE